jgi:asparagine synthetase B (glutamine-hydrolysing)
LLPEDKVKKSNFFNPALIPSFLGAYKGQAYTSKAKVLLSGLGADEQLGGYGRHAVRFKLAGWEGLINELQLDVSRINQRNLGRDDRIVSDHGKEVRYPFLDEAFVDFLCMLPVHMKCDPRLAKGLGDKILLRAFMRFKGFSQVATEPKRAIQFGARTAKMESTDKGHVALF